jgi:hypothetical protein
LAPRSSCPKPGSYSTTRWMILRSIQRQCIRPCGQ